MRKANIDVTKIDKTALFKGAKGTYLDLVFMDNREGRDQYDNDGFVVQDIGKERREAGERGPILGNWKEIDTTPRHPEPGGNTNHDRAQEQMNAPARETVTDDSPDIPF